MHKIFLWNAENLFLISSTLFCHKCYEISVAHRTGGWKGGLATLERAVSPFNLGTASSIKIESMNQTRKYRKSSWSIKNYVEKNKIKRFILVTDNASFHVSRKSKQFIENQSGDWLIVIFPPKRSPNLNPV